MIIPQLWKVFINIDFWPGKLERKNESLLPDKELVG